MKSNRISHSSNPSHLTSRLTMRHTHFQLAHRMPPVRHREARHSLSSKPSSAQRCARRLAIDPSSANGFIASTPNELDSAFAAKELELSSLLSPSTPTQSSQGFLPPEQLNSFPWKELPNIINSFDSFNAMKTVFLEFLVKSGLSHMIPDSKLYRSVYFPYGCLPAHFIS